MNAIAELGVDHDYLVSVAVQWLRRCQRCYVVIAELRTVNAREIPDAIGFHAGGFSILVECKMSRADFLRDRKKGEKRMGGQRYYMVPDGLIMPDEVGEKWGLVYVRDGRCRIIKDPQRWEVNHRATRREVRLLVDALRRVPHPAVHVRGVS